MRLEQYSGAHLNLAIDLYLAQAYQGGKQPRRSAPRFAAEMNMVQILSQAHPFEDLNEPAPPGVPALPGGKSREYALRLGNEAYPHMKLAVVEVYFPDEFVLVVDRHDAFHFAPGMPGYQAWCELKEINRQKKEVIEAAWYEHGLPTLRRLREERFGPAEELFEEVVGGRPILILDDDSARAEILSGILSSQGFDALPGPTGPRADREPDTSPAESRADSRRRSVRDLSGALDVSGLCELIQRLGVVLVVLDVSYCTGHGQRVAAALKNKLAAACVPILGLYSIRDLELDPRHFDEVLRRPYQVEALLAAVQAALRAGYRKLLLSTASHKPLPASPPGEETPGAPPPPA